MIFAFVSLLYLHLHAELLTLGSATFVLQIFSGNSTLTLEFSNKYSNDFIIKCFGG